MPTGVHLFNARTLLFDAAEAVLRRDGVGGLTSRAVATEAGVAKGVIHRHFPDFDGMLAELLVRRAGQVTELGERLAGEPYGGVVDYLAGALAQVFTPLTVAEMALVVTRSGLAEHLSQAGAARLPLLSAATDLVRTTLLAAQETGRLAPAAEPATLGSALVGAAHLLYTECQPGPPDAETLRKVIHTVVGGTLTDDPRNRRRSTSRPSDGSLRPRGGRR
jgi:AcrR family transcriptional regulator